MQWLIIKPTSPEATTADYALFEQKDEQVSFTHSQWSTIKDYIGNRRVILLIPSEEVSLHQTAIPTTNNKQMAKAIPFALEDSLAEDIDELHFAFYREKPHKTNKQNKQNKQNKTNKSDNDVNVAVINQKNLQHWYETAQQQWGIKPYAILPDFLALPADDNTSSLVVHQERVLYRYNTFLGISCTRDLLPLLLPSFVSHKEPQQDSNNNNNNHDYDDNHDSDGNGDNTAITPPILLLDKPDTLALDIPTYIDVQPTTDLYKHCHRSLLAALPLNLLTGFGNNEQVALLKNLKKWKAVAVLAGLIAVLWSVSTGLKNYHSQQHLQQLNEAITSVYKDTLPNANVDSDYRINHQVMEEKLKALGVAKPKAASPLEPLALVTPILKRNNSIKLKKLSIENNELILAITANSVSRLESFNAIINRHAKLQAEIKSQNTTDNKVLATLHIRKKEP